MDLGSYENLLVEQRGSALLVTLNRPKALNALAGGVIDDLTALLDRLEQAVGDGAWPVRGVVLTGAGEKAFVAGADIVEMSAMTAAQGEEYSRRMQQVTLRLERLPLPVVAAVNGFALGGGCELALACDWAYASANARFGQPEVNLGLVPGFGGSVRLTRRVGIAWARELILTGRMIDAPEALRIGLVNRVVETPAEVVDAACATVDALAGISPVAVAAAKRLVDEVAVGTVEQGLDAEATAFGVAFDTQDKAEGVRAFVAKEKPAFPGR